MIDRIAMRREVAAAVKRAMAKRKADSPMSASTVGLSAAIFEIAKQVGDALHELDERITALEATRTRSRKGARNG